MCDWSEFVHEYCLRALDTSTDPASGHLSVNTLGIVIEIVVFSTCFHFIATLGEAFMSPAFESLSLRLGGISEVVASVLIAVTLSLPETSISFLSALKGEFSTNHSLAISTIIGSGWISLLLIPGIVSLRMKAEFPGIAVFRDIVFFGIMIMLLQRTIEDDTVTVGESLLFMFFYGLYFLSLSLTQLIERKQRTQRRQSRVLVQLAPLQNLIEETELLERLPIDMALSHEEFTSGMEPMSLPRPPVSEHFLLPDSSGDDFMLYPVKYKETVTSRILSFVCVKASPGTDTERLYMVSIINIFAIQLLLSSIITAVSNRWVLLVSADQATGSTNLVGSVVVGFFSKLTDILHALSATTPFAANHVVTSSLASQIFSIGIGLGLTWCINGAIRGSTHIDNSAVKFNVRIGLVAVGILALFSVFNFRDSKICYAQPKLMLCSYFLLVLGFIILSLE